MLTFQSFKNEKEKVSIQRGNDPKSADKEAQQFSVDRSQMVKSVK